MRIVLFGLMFMLCLLGHAQAEVKKDSAYYLAFGQCKAHCLVSVIQENGGGSVKMFQRAAVEALQGKVARVIIDGPCWSSCAIFADQARDLVCITSKAMFGFHMIRNWSESLQILGPKNTQPAKGAYILYYSEPPQSLAVEEWVLSHGGYPRDTFLEMRYADARHFWRTCLGK